MRRCEKLGLKSLPLAVVLGLLAAFFTMGCKPPAEPDFVGAWSGSLPPGTLTMTLSATAFSSFYDGGATTETILGSVEDYDADARHILLLVKEESYTGIPPTTPAVPGENLYILYSISGDTLAIAWARTAYPTDLSGGLTLGRQ